MRINPGNMDDNIFCDRRDESAETHGGGPEHDAEIQKMPVVFTKSENKHSVLEQVRGRRLDWCKTVSCSSSLLLW